MAKNKQEAGSKSEKKLGAGAIIGVFLGVFLLVPLGIFGLAYTFNDSVKNLANPVLSQLPGPIGSFFENMPTAAETNSQVQQISDYLLGLDESRAVDKLKLIQKEDAKLYNEVVKGMLRQDPTSAEALLEKMRQSNMKKNALVSTLDSIKSEADSALKNRAKYIDSLPIAAALEEIKTILDENKDGAQKVADILQYSADARTAAYLQALQPQDKMSILNSFKPEKADAIRTVISKNESEANTLKKTAQILASEDMKKLVSMLGNVDTYKIDQLAKIYTELGPVKAGEVLANVPDKDLVFKVLNTIKDQQSLEPNGDKLTDDIQKSLNVYAGFADNVNKLNTVFSALDEQKTSDMLKKYFQNGANYKAYPLSNGQEIRISDEDLALAVMKGMSQKKVASILSNYDSNLASEVSKKLALPKIK